MKQFKEFFNEDRDICPECHEDPCVCGGNHVEEETKLDEISANTAKSYMQKAMHDTISGKKDRNPGMQKAINRLAGLSKPLMTVKEEKEKHRVSVTVSEPDHPAVSKRKEQQQKFIRVSAMSKEEAKSRAESHYKKQGYKVHGSEHVGMVKEDVEQIDEMQQGKEYTQKQLHDKIKSGNWEATHDIKPGKSVEMRHHTGKRVTVQVKHEMKEEVDQVKESKFDKYITKSTPTTPGIKKVSNPAGRSGDHIEWEVTGKSSADKRTFNTKKAAMEYLASFAKEEVEGVAEGYTQSPEEAERIRQQWAKAHPDIHKDVAKAEHEMKRHTNYEYASGAAYADGKAAHEKLNRLKAIRDMINRREKKPEQSTEK